MKDRCRCQDLQYNSHVKIGISVLLHIETAPHDCFYCFIFLPSFMLVSAVVSELRESNQNKKEKEKNSEIGYFQFMGKGGRQTSLLHPRRCHR